MESIISFSFNGGRGHATIVLDKFFPTDATRLRKLLKMVDEDYEHRDELRAIIVQHCNQRAADLTEGKKALANKAVDLHTKATEMQPEIDKITGQVETLASYGRRYQKQLKELRTQLKAKKEEQRLALSGFHDYQRKFISAENEAKKLRKNVEVVNNVNK